MTTFLQPSLDTMAADWGKIAEDAPIPAQTVLTQLMAAARFRVPEGRPELPMIILASEKDGFVDASCSRALARHLGAPILLHPSAGHDLPLDDPKWVASQINQWMGTGSSGSRGP
jgi:pimeloyl-ACP methyl ester carboxylesterase